MKNKKFNMEIPEYPEFNGSHRYKDNPNEKIIVDLWEDKDKSGRILKYLLSREPNHPGKTTKRDQLVAKRIIQWLGSPVGNYFLETYLRRKKK